MISLVTCIMGILAAKKAEPDEKNFKTAYTALIVGVFAIIVMLCIPLVQQNHQQYRVTR